jgi:hypothetical protein
MKSFLGKMLVVATVLLVILAGIFCYQGIQSTNLHCSVDMNHTSFWCSDFLSHGTIISDAITATLFTVLSILVVFISIKPIIALFSKLKQLIRYKPKIRDKIPILPPILLAISNGIIHPRIP